MKMYLKSLNEHDDDGRPVSLNGSVFVYELSGCGFESYCSHLDVIYRACFEQVVPWHLSNYKIILKKKWLK